MTPDSGHVPHHLGEHLASKALRLLDGGMPTDLERLAVLLGVEEVRKSQLREDGRTTWTDGRPVVELRSDRPLQRQRFTFAHELGHVLLASNRLTDVRLRTQSLDQDAEETLCDWVAAALLMPAHWVRPLLDRPITLPRLRAIANSANVSLSAAAVRVSELGRRPCILLRWQRSSAGGWHLVGQAGVPAPLVGTLSLDVEDGRLFNALARRDERCELRLSSAGRPLEPAPAEASKRGTTVMTLITCDLRQPSSEPH